jgi:hypothetical protein
VQYTKEHRRALFQFLFYFHHSKPLLDHELLSLSFPQPPLPHLPIQDRDKSGRFPYLGKSRFFLISFDNL